MLYFVPFRTVRGDLFLWWRTSQVFSMVCNADLMTLARYGIEAHSFGGGCAIPV
jgi:hypothetical protein